MTMRQLAVKAMQEVGYSKERIDKTLEFMDMQDKNLLSDTEAPVPEDNFEMAMERARDFFRKNKALPMDN